MLLVLYSALWPRRKAGITVFEQANLLGRNYQVTKIAERAFYSLEPERQSSIDLLMSF